MVIASSLLADFDKDCDDNSEEKSRCSQITAGVVSFTFYNGNHQQPAQHVHFLLFTLVHICFKTARLVHTGDFTSFHLESDLIST